MNIHSKINSRSVTILAVSIKDSLLQLIHIFFRTCLVYQTACKYKKNLNFKTLIRNSTQFVLTNDKADLRSATTLIKIFDFAIK